MFQPQGCGNLPTWRPRQLWSLTFRAAHHTFGTVSLGSFQGTLCLQAKGGWVRLRFPWTDELPVPAPLTRRSTADARVERGCLPKQELTRASGPLRLSQPCPKDGGFLVPNQKSPFKNHVSKVLL